MYSKEIALIRFNRHERDQYNEAATVILIDGALEIEDAVRLELRLGGMVYAAESERGYFHAFQKIRQELEVIGFYPHCYAAAENVHPSGMIEAMGDAVTAYRLTMGQPAKQADLVNIFETEDGLEGATVEQQERFYINWIKSL